MLSMQKIRWRFRRKNKNKSIPKWAETLVTLPPHVSWPLCIATCFVSVALLMAMWQICSTVEKICSVLLRAQLAASLAGGHYPALFAIAANTVRVVLQGASRGLGW